MVKHCVLVKPTYGDIGPNPFRPTTREVLREWVDSINFVPDRTRLLPALYAGYHLATFGVFVYFLTCHFSWLAVLSVAALATFIGTIYNTVWYHRYCSHQAYKFRSVWFARFFLWTNPICYREENYVLPHRIHHSKSDEVGDPYGPHLGWLGSYLATETQQKTNRDLSPEEYARVVKSLRHVGFLNNSYAQFQRTGSVENVWHYFAKVIVVHLLWLGLAYAVAGWMGVMAWLSSVFLFTFIVRDFNFRGHASLVGGEEHGAPVNQVIYGIIAGEWHENHHDHPLLARSGFKWWQIDLPFWIILLMKAGGIVTQCNAEVPLAPVSALPTAARQESMPSCH